MKKAIGFLLIAAACAAAAWGVWRYRSDQSKTGDYRLGRIERGDVVQTVRATGQVQPIRLVQVGTQVNGPVQKLYVDYNTEVKSGDLVAQIDPTVYEARLAQDEANQAESLASVDQSNAKLAQAEKDLVRAKELAKRDMLSQAELDAAQATRDTLAAQLKVSQAAVEQAKAALRLSKANLGYTTIRSPVDGVVVARNVSEGQTVVASMSAQVLFLIATDLREVQVEASVPEADIGRIRVDQPVTFTVDAYEEEFQGKVSEIRLSASTVQNVVTYPVVIRAANPERKLYPSMTANIVCEVARHEGVLKIPNAALRFKPAVDTAKPSHTNAAAASASGESAPAEGTNAAVASAEGADGTNGAVRGAAGERPRGEGRPSGERRFSGGGEGRPGGARGEGSGRRFGGGGGEGGSRRGMSGQKIWVPGPEGGDPVPVYIRTGITDGAFTEIMGPPDRIREGQEIIVGLAETAASTAAAKVNPFTPSMPGGPPRGGGGPPR